ncbi:MAG: hypothetical protein COW08_05890 [Ignavibacteriales bacterium CG12_big_fil_rev_8_21_14_0_65_30_8]|nr:MAG: hypothetical protein COW08_05890 [Ignavibacteriales bacterium CG12_big_fil_rev_8_21_14_0_65_30_8]
MKNNSPIIIFVYNADSGYFNKLTDSAHKLLSPSTYSCNLCSISHSSFGMKKEWKEFLHSIKYQLEFLHRNELSKKYNITKINLPAILIKENNSIRILIKAPYINSCKNIDDLKELINKEITCL